MGESIRRPSLATCATYDLSCAVKKLVAAFGAEEAGRRLALLSRAVVTEEGAPCPR